MSGRARLPRRRILRGVGLAVLFTVLLAAATAAAAEVEPLAQPLSAEARSVVVSPPLCKANSFEFVAFLDSLRVELAGRGLSCCDLAPVDRAVPTAGTLLVTVEIVPCTPDADRLRVSARAPVDSRAVEREISLADVARPARPRALALAVAELIRWLEQGVESIAAEAITTPVRVATPAPAPSPSGPEEPVGFSIQVEADARRLPTRDTTMWGGRARFVASRRLLHVDLDLGGSYARAETEIGVVLLRSASAALGAGPRFATRTLVADVGLRAELGWAWIRGETALAEVRTGAASDLIASAGLRLSIEAPAQGRTRLGLALEGGGVIRGVRAEVSGRPVAGMTGYYLLAGLGIAVSL
jgi:hypothetical protein